MSLATATEYERYKKFKLAGTSETNSELVDLCWPLLKRKPAQTTGACDVGVFLEPERFYLPS